MCFELLLLYSLVVLVSQKLELFPDKESSDKEDVASTKVLKLFGKDLVVPGNPSDSSSSLSKSPSSDMGRVVQAYPEDSKPTVLDNQTSFSMNKSTNVEKPVPLPWWVFRGFDIPSCGDPQEKETQREGSSADSSSDSVNGEQMLEKNWDAETESGLCAQSSDKESKTSANSSPEKEPTLFEKRTSIDNGRKGFVPYKRCLSERDMQSSTITSEDRENQRIRLCL